MISRSNILRIVAAASAVVAIVESCRLVNALIKSNQAIQESSKALDRRRFQQHYKPAIEY